MQEIPRTGLRHEEELRTFFEMSLDMLCIAGFDGYFKRINLAWESTLGHTKDELLASPYLDFVHPDDRAHTADEAARLNAGMDTISFENRYRCKDDSYRWLLWRAHADFEASLVYAVARDITDRKRAEDSLRATAAELARSNSELAQFAHVASHDLQEPLRMVASFVQLIEKRYAASLDEEGRKYITFAVEGAKRMQALIHALLSLSRVQSRARPLETTDCAQVFRNVMTDLQIAIAEAGATVTCGTLPTVMADGVQLAQLFQNLLGNALKFRGVGPTRIRVGAVRRTGEWEFSVSDNGIGIDPQFFERIFGIFQRLHSQAELPGTGIGLAVCRKIVECHGGRMWVESAPGRGSTFFFTIPDKKPSMPG
ncbi:MAG: ATP-binding protein [Chthoniobacteraceae bacterium]